MKKIKLLPSVLMLALCIGILGIGIYAATPTNNVITGTITVNAANAGIKVEVFEGQDTTGTKKGEATGRTQTEIDLQNIAIDASNALTLEDVPVKYYTIRFSTTSTHKFVVDTETIQLVNGTVTETSATKEDAIIITKNHKTYKEDTESGLAYFTAGEGNEYVITCAIKLGELPEQAFTASFDMVFDVYKLDDWVEMGNTGINGVDYLHLGEYPQAKSTETTDFGEAVGTFAAYNDAATKTSEIETTRDVYAKEGKLYVEMSGEYYEIQPLKWRILDKQDSQLKLMCDTIVEQVKYYLNQNNRTAEDGSIIYANNYKESSLRKYLTSIFYENAFSDIEKNLIQETLVDNSEGGAYSCENTEDRIFALSYNDISGSPDFDPEKQIKANDYSYATGVYCGARTESEVQSKIFKKDNKEDCIAALLDEAGEWCISSAELAEKIYYGLINSGNWLLRTPFNQDPQAVEQVEYSGQTVENYADGAGSGCIPAMNIKL